MTININIPEQCIAEAGIAPSELLLNFAIYMYERKILSIGQAKALVGMDLINFQMKLAQRNVYIHYDIVDLEKDLANLKGL